MFDQSHGLRFDIYERIHLSEELPGIAELEEVELLPEIQVTQREDRAELHGHLMLTGLYRCEDDRVQRLEHAIPVEITVPLTRVSSIEDIGVEIENFDIDLLTMRSVNITGVLSLQGIGGAEAAPVWQQEEYTVAHTSEEGERITGADAHERENDALYENSVWTFGEGAVEEIAEENQAGHGAVAALPNHPPSMPSVQEKDKELIIHSISNDADVSQGEFVGAWQEADPWSSSGSSSERSDSGNVESINADANQADVAVLKVQNQSEPNEPNEPVTVQADSMPEAEDAEASDPLVAGDLLAAQEMPSPPEDKPDLKIALNSKREPAVEEKAALSFSSLLSSSQSRREKDVILAQEAADAAPLAPVDTGKDSEWKSRFISGNDGSNLFRKVRLCIVQRAETLDTIAEKYQLSARELVMYNRLSGQNVEEGQVLYIP